MSHFEDDPAGETQLDREPTSLEPIPPSAFGAAPHSRLPPAPPGAKGAPHAPQLPQGTQSPPQTIGKFAAPPPSEQGRFVQPVHQTRPIEQRPVTYYDAPVTEPPRMMVMAIGVSVLFALLQAVTNTPSMLLLPGCAPAQIVFAMLVAITCWRGRTYGRPLAVLGLLAWMFAAAVAIRGHGNMVALLSYESSQRGHMSEAMRVVIVVRAVIEVGLVWSLFRPDAHKYFAHRSAVDKLGGRKWE